MRIGKIVIILFTIMLTGVMPNTTNIVMGLTGPDTIFGVDSSGNLSSISTTTGVATTVGPLGGIYTECGAIDFDPVSGTLYGICPDGLGDFDLVTISTTTGTATFVGQTGITGDMRDISFNSGGALFAIGFATADFNSMQLFSVNLSSGAATDVSGTNLPFGNDGDGMAFDAANTLWHSDNGADKNINTMHNINTVTEAVSTIYASASYNGFPAFTSPNGAIINAMDVDTATNTMCASTFDGVGGGGPAYLSSVDIVTTGDVTLIGQTVNGLDGIAFQAGQEIIGGVGLPIDTTALLIAGFNANSIWMLPAILGLAVAGLVIQLVRRKKPENP